MNKGFIFTIDCIFAVIVAAALITALSSMQQAEKGKEKFFETASEKSRDKAIVETYNPTGTNDAAPQDSNYYYSINTTEYKLPKETVMPRAPVDVALVMDVSESMGEQDMQYYKTQAKTVFGGTCNGGGACSTAADCANPDTSSMQELGQINIEPENPLFTIRKDVSTYGAYSGNCTGPKTLIKSPTGIYYDFTNKNNCTTPSQPLPIIAGDCCYGETGTGECTNVTIWSWPKLLTGAWAIYGWADQPTDFFQTNYYITRIDSAKKASKTFFDNPGWKTTDTFGLVGFSCCADSDHLTTDPCSCCSRQITTCMALNSDRTPIRAEIDKMAPVHGTDTDKGIIAASSILSAGANKKYIVLLTDGLATNVPAFLAEAANARSAGITIYAIGFAATNIIKAIEPSTGRIYEDILEEAAKDKDTSYCSDGINCGKYYFAPTNAELENIYQLIANEMSSGEIGAQGPIVTVKKIGG